MAGETGWSSTTCRSDQERVGEGYCSLRLDRLSRRDACAVHVFAKSFTTSGCKSILRS